MSVQPKRTNLFATVLTYPAPSANYGGETELNRRVIQKVTDGRWDYPIISPESMRNALREILATYDGLACNRHRIHPLSGKGKEEDGVAEDKQQLAVQFEKYPDPDAYVDDFFFGYLLAVKGAELTKLRAAKGATYPMKRDSVLRMNMAKALAPHRHNAVFTQSPQIKDSPWTPGGGDAKSKSGLLHRETAVTAFQFPFALAWNDCKSKPTWTRSLLKAIGELNGVAGNHARSYFEMAPASIIVRLTPQLVAGYDTYGFRIQRDPLDEQLHTHLYPEVIEGLLHDPPDYTPDEFYVGGKIVKDLETDHDHSVAEFDKAQARKEPKDTRPKTRFERLKVARVVLERNPRRLLERVAEKFTEGMA